MTNDNDLDFITVVEGFFYHRGFTKNNLFIEPGISHKVHDFRITGRTYHTGSKRLLRTCTVLSNDGDKHELVITGIFHAKSGLAKHIASHLQPVINFRENGLEDPALTKEVCKHSLVEERIKTRQAKHLTLTNK